MSVAFRDRADAGRRLGAALVRRGEGGVGAPGHGVVVLGLPRGGVPVAAEVARVLDAPLDVVVVRKLGVPWQPELAMGAIGEGGTRVLDDEIRRAADVGADDLAAVEAAERAQLDQRVERLRGVRPRIDLAGRVVVVVDDGIATGATARVACGSARARGARRVVLAVPVAPPSAVSQLAPAADEVLCLATPRDFVAVGRHYLDFSATSDDEVIELLRQANSAARSAALRTP